MSRQSTHFKQYLQKYVSSSTIHGIPYIFDPTDKFFKRTLFWIFVLVISIFFATWWSCNIYVSWKSDPVLTTIDNFAFPVTKIKFPSITICPQGADNSILGSVLFKQFNEYLGNKNLKLEELTKNQLEEESIKFLNETYPGAKKSPDNYVTLFRVQNLDSNIRTQANINPEDSIQNCNGTENTKSRRRRKATSDACPPMTISNEEGKCFALSSQKLTYSDAVSYCENVVTDRKSGIHQFFEDSDFTSIYKILDKGIHVFFKYLVFFHNFYTCSLFTAFHFCFFFFD